MNHILQFAIDIDDKRIVDAVMQSAEKQIIEDISNSVHEALYEKLSKYSYYGSTQTESPTPILNMARSRVDEIIDENKDLILKEATKLLADKIYKSKSCKEFLKKMNTLIDDELGGTDD